MEVSLESLKIENLPIMNELGIVEDNSIYEECAICCESFTNKAFINECLHPFCYQCIIDWTKVKAVCPLCVRPITRILHNIRSQDDYDVFEVVPPLVDVLATVNNDYFLAAEDTDTDSSYGEMESMDMESDIDDSFIYGDDDFEDHNLETGNDNFSGYLCDNDTVSVHSNEDEETEDEEAEEPERDSSDLEEDDNNEFCNVVSDSDVEDEREDEEYECESNYEGDDNDDYLDTVNYDANDNESNYSDDEYDVGNHSVSNYSSDHDDHEYEEEHENEVEAVDISDDGYENHDDYVHNGPYNQNGEYDHDDDYETHNYESWDHSEDEDEYFD